MSLIWTLSVVTFLCLRHHGAFILPRVQLFQDPHELSDASGEPEGGDEQNQILYHNFSVVKVNVCVK